MKKTAILLGASGLIGNLLLDLLLQDNDYEKIKLFSRKSIGYQHPKIEEHLIDLLELDKYAAVFSGDVVFCCIGTTKSKTPDQSQYTAIDFGIPNTAAQLAKTNNIPAFIVISALGADSNSTVFYNRTKGQMENAVLQHTHTYTYILRPSLIYGNRNETRTAEQIAIRIMKIVNPLLPGSLKKYRSITALEIAKAMLYLSKKVYPDNIIPSDKIKQLAKNYSS